MICLFRIAWYIVFIECDNCDNENGEDMFVWECGVVESVVSKFLGFLDPQLLSSSLSAKCSWSDLEVHDSPWGRCSIDL